MGFIQAISGGRYLNHIAKSGGVGASRSYYESGTGRFDGTLWNLVDAGNGLVLINGITSNMYLNYSGQTGQVHATKECFDPSTGANDGTLWKEVDLGNGHALLLGVTCAKYLNHNGSNGMVTVTDERWNPQSGAYDGTLWRTEHFRIVLQDAKLGTAGEWRTKILNRTGKVVVSVSPDALSIPALNDEIIYCLPTGDQSGTGSVVLNPRVGLPISAGQLSIPGLSVDPNGALGCRAYVLSGEFGPGLVTEVPIDSF